MFDDIDLKRRKHFTLIQLRVTS